MIWVGRNSPSTQRLKNQQICHCLSACLQPSDTEDWPQGERSQGSWGWGTYTILTWKSFSLQHRSKPVLYISMWMGGAVCVRPTPVNTWKHVCRRPLGYKCACIHFETYRPWLQVLHLFPSKTRLAFYFLDFNIIPLVRSTDLASKSSLCRSHREQFNKKNQNCCSTASDIITPRLRPLSPGSYINHKATWLPRARWEIQVSTETRAEQHNECVVLTFSCYRSCFPNIHSPSDVMET